MYCAYLVLSELQLNSNILNLRHAGKVDHEHPITGMLRYSALIKRARRKPNQSSELPYTEFRHMEAILQKVAADKGIELPNSDELELALYDQLGPPTTRTDCRHRPDLLSHNPNPITAAMTNRFRQRYLKTRSKNQIPQLLASIPRRTNRHRCAKNKQRSLTKELTSGTSHPMRLFAQGF